MSHRDPCPPKIRLNVDALKTALSWLLRGTERQQLDWRSDCTWRSPLLLVVAALLWAWSDEQTVGERFSTARSIALRMFPQTQHVAASYQAFMKLLKKWSTPLICEVRQVLRARIVKEFSDYMQVAGYLLFAIDGSRAELPRTAAHERVFSCGLKRGQRRSELKAGKATSVRKPMPMSKSLRSQRCG